MKSQIVFTLFVGLAILAQVSHALKEEDCEGMHIIIIHFWYDLIN